MKSQAKRSSKALSYCALSLLNVLITSAFPLTAGAANYQYIAPTRTNPSGVLMPRSSASYGGTNSVRNGLPPTVMDSFVNEAQEHKEAIYGDESQDGPPPYMLFTEDHRINTGILDQRDKGLTTGHGSYMPDGVGGDEFLSNEWSQSGTRGVSAADWFYNGVSYALPSAYPQNASQFPQDPTTGQQYNVLQSMNGQIDERRWRTPPPLQWNASKPAPFLVKLKNGQMKQVSPIWFRSGNGWSNEIGDYLKDDGTITYGLDRYYDEDSLEVAAGTTVYPDGSTRLPNGQMARPVY